MSTRKHVIVTSYPAFGHYIPMLEVAQRIVPYHDVTMIVSNTMEKAIRQRHLLPPAPIRFYPLDDQFSLDFEDTLPDFKIMFAVMNEQAPPYAKFISILNGKDAPLPHVDALFCDVFHFAPCQPCYDKNIPVYIVSNMPVFWANGVFSITEGTPAVPDDAMLASAPEYNSEKKSPQFILPESWKQFCLHLQNAVQNCKAVLLNSFEALEPTGLQELQQIPFAKDKVFKFIGPLMPTEEKRDKKVQTDASLSTKVIQWLDGQKERSVVYCSFGSVAMLSKEQLVEIGHALVSLKQPFIWALRPSQQDHLPDIVQRLTGEDFSMELSYLIVPWVQQKAVLAHKATGVFISHCGWNSTLESASYGVPIVAWPFFGDQPLNAAFVEQRGIGRIMPGTGTWIPTLVPTQQIVATVKEVGGFVDGEKGRSPFGKNIGIISDKAKEVVSSDGSSTQNMRDIVKSL
ncbi:uncharacterized protein LOC129587527 [Paramacrobiotus metropolitanus]|uniref:uncharacterized protein LOC129587527 n=1 Tax=Paramacrobiotus metropolitanus TaxID=2943436 RepID=UPI002445681B|nr:uncharacterized protein LOC129587527 [Paramacrobiotus metropolitanus]